MGQGGEKWEGRCFRRGARQVGGRVAAGVQQRGRKRKVTRDGTEETAWCRRRNCSCERKGMLVVASRGRVGNASYVVRCAIVVMPHTASTILGHSGL